MKQVASGNYAKDKVVNHSMYCTELFVTTNTSKLSYYLNFHKMFIFHKVHTICITY